ncbi:MAG: hypothetical protein AB7S81_01290 [Bdellovibrionales bacterium]
MAEEENLFSTNPPLLFVGLYPSIDETQVKILEGTIISRAERIGCSAILFHEAFLNAYQIEELKDLPHRHFDEAIDYLMSFAGAN